MLTNKSVLGSGTGLEDSGPSGAGAAEVCQDISGISASIFFNSFSFSVAIAGMGRPVSDWHGQGARTSRRAERGRASRKV